MNFFYKLYFWVESLFDFTWQPRHTKRLVAIISGLLAVSLLLVVYRAVTISNTNRVYEKNRIESVRKARQSLEEIKGKSFATTHLRVSDSVYRSVSSNPDLQTVGDYAVLLASMYDKSTKELARDSIRWYNDNAMGKLYKIGDKVEAKSKHAIVKNIAKTYGNKFEIYAVTLDVTTDFGEGEEFKSTSVVLLTFSQGEVFSWSLNEGDFE